MQLPRRAHNFAPTDEFFNKRMRQKYFENAVKTPNKEFMK